ncbi:MAG TPA: hypothetical protein DD426_13790 [Clostridiaceae bacterium]|nr:hypothetical protein [Clostridiaceae bacterium]
MPDIFYGSNYSSGWRPLIKDNGSDKKTDINLEIKIKEIENKYDKLTEDVISESQSIQQRLNEKIHNLSSMLNKKNEEIDNLTAQNKVLSEKYELLAKQLSDFKNDDSGFFGQFVKKIIYRKSHQDGNMHSID